MMKKKVVAGLIGMIITISAAGLAYGATTTQSETTKQNSRMMNMDGNKMGDMMSNPDMQQQCTGMMKNPEMQQSMMQMMQQPEMQDAMKQMLKKDAQFHKMMLDLVESVDVDVEHASQGNNGQDSPKQATDQVDHAAHHQ